MDAPHWSVARTEQNREAVAVRHLQRAGFVVYLPKLATTVIRRHKKTLVIRPLWPNYLLVLIETIYWGEISRTPGITKLLLNDGAPARLPNVVVDSLKAQERNGFVQLPDAPPRLKPGDPVKVIGGPMEGLAGLYQNQSSQDRVVILLSLFRSQQRVTLPAALIEPAV